MNKHIELTTRQKGLERFARGLKRAHQKTQRFADKIKSIHADRKSTPDTPNEQDK